MDNINGYLSYNKELEKWFFGIASESRPYRARHTQKELENAGFGWVFNCEGVEIKKGIRIRLLRGEAIALALRGFLFVF